MRPKKKKDDPYLIELGQRIYQQRQRVGLTQDQLAECTDTSKQSISGVENGHQELRVRNFHRICQALKTSSDYMLTGQPNTHDPIFIGRDLGSLTPAQLEKLKKFIDFYIEVCKADNEG